MLRWVGQGRWVGWVGKVRRGREGVWCAFPCARPDASIGYALMLRLGV